MIEQFVKENLGAYQNRVLKIVESVAIFSPDLVQPLVPKISQLVKINELKRGVGIDKQLR